MHVTCMLGWLRQTCIYCVCHQYSTCHIWCITSYWLPPTVCLAYIAVMCKCPRGRHTCALCPSKHTQRVLSQYNIQHIVMLLGPFIISREKCMLILLNHGIVHQEIMIPYFWSVRLQSRESAQMVERLLSMQEALGSIPRFSIFFNFKPGMCLVNLSATSVCVCVCVCVHTRSHY